MHITTVCLAGVQLFNRESNLFNPIFTIPDGFGYRLAEERRRLGFSQSELAAAAGIKRLAQSQYERETSSPTVRYLTAIAHVGINIHQLLFDDVPPVEQLSANDLYRIERQAFELVEEQIQAQSHADIPLGAEARFALFQLFKSQLTKSVLKDTFAKPRLTTSS